MSAGYFLYDWICCTLFSGNGILENLHHLATVVGLIVAIPALFIYSYLNGRIKTVMANMQVFIDEFVAKMAEFYRPPNEPEGQAGKSIS